MGPAVVSSETAAVARSQFRGGMTTGLSAALLEHSVVDSRFGHVIIRGGSL